MMQISLTRFTNVLVYPIYDSNNKLESIKIYCTITNINLTTPPQVNDYLSATSIGNWFVDIINYLIPTMVNNPKNIPSIESFPVYKTSYNSSNEPPLPRTTVQTNPTLIAIPISLPQSFTNVSNKFKSTIEAFTPAIGGQTDPVTGKINLLTGTLSIFDYIFQYSFFISFAGAIVLGLKLFNFDILDNLFNETVTKYLYLLIGLSGIVSFFAWLDMQIFFIDPKIINIQNVIM